MKGLGVDAAQIDAFDAHDDAALDHHIGQAHAVATALGALDEADHSVLWGESGVETLAGGMGDDTIDVTAVKAPSPFESRVAQAGQAIANNVGGAYSRIANSPSVAERIGREEVLRASEQAKRAGANAHNDRFDAERHARWTYRMAKELSPAEASLYGGLHELTDLYRWAFPSEAHKNEPRMPLGQQLNENRMDLHNNAIGIRQEKAGGGVPDPTTPGLIWFRGRDGKYPTAR